MKALAQIAATLREGRKGYTTETVSNLTYGQSGFVSKVGLPIGQDSALRLTAVYACVRLISETVASLPVHLYRKDGSKRVQLEPPAWLVKPNPEITRFELFERTLASLNLDGNAFWYFEHDRLGRIGEVWPLHPSSVAVERDPETKEIRYRVGSTTFDDQNILHIRAFAGSGGLRGLSPIGLHKDGALALASALEEHGAQFFKNGSVMSGVIEAPQAMDKPALEAMAAKWVQDHSGSANAHLPGFLTGGATWKQITIPNDHAQFLESRNFQIAEVCRIYRVQPHKVHELSRATFSNIEHQNIEFAQDTIRPWVTRIEVAASPLLEGDTYLRFDMNALLRGDTISRFTAYNMGVNAGWLKGDEPRAWEDLDPMPDGAGQIFRAPLNTAAVNGPVVPDLMEQVNAASALVRAGFEPAGALRLVGLDPIAHLGLLPITVQRPQEGQ